MLFFQSRMNFLPDTLTLRTRGQVKEQDLASAVKNSYAKQMTI